MFENSFIPGFLSNSPTSWFPKDFLISLLQCKGSENHFSINWESFFLFGGKLILMRSGIQTKPAGRTKESGLTLRQKTFSLSLSAFDRLNTFLFYLTLFSFSLWPFVLEFRRKWTKKKNLIVIQIWIEILLRVTWKRISRAKTERIFFFQFLNNCWRSPVRLRQKKHTGFSYSSRYFIKQNLFKKKKHTQSFTP